MAKKTYEELVQLKQDGKIGWLEFLQLGDDAEDFKNWCDEHGEQQSEENAELFIEMQEYWVTEDFNEVPDFVFQAITVEEAGQIYEIPEQFEIIINV